MTEREETTCKEFIHIGNAMSIGFGYAQDKYNGTLQERCLSCPMGQPIKGECLDYVPLNFNWQGMWENNLR